MHKFWIHLFVWIPLMAVPIGIWQLWGWGVDIVYLTLFVGLYLTSAIGITAGFHRLFTHQSFRTYRWIEALLGIWGSMAAQGPVKEWVATHFKHHAHSDESQDPHSPHHHGQGLKGVSQGFFHAHMGWLFSHRLPEEEKRKYAKHLLNRQLVNWIDRTFIWWVALGLLLPAGLGYLYEGWHGAWLGGLWGGLIRMSVVHHVTWSTNSICHLWGRQDFKTADRSRNNWLLSVLSLGESWHNGHHAFQGSARHGLKWYQIDLTWYFIKLLSVAGLAWQIKLPSETQIRKKGQA